MSTLPLENQSPPTTDGSARWHWTAWLVLIGVAYCAYLIHNSAVIRVTLPWSLNPWESEIIMDAVRTTRGIDVYQMPDKPATHMYGFLTTYLNAAVFQAVGPNLHSPRVIALVSSLLLSVAFAVILARRQGLLVQIIAFVLVMIQMYRSRAAYAETRPDAISVFFGFISLCMLHQGYRTRKLAWTTFGTVVMLIAFCFKQTVAPAAMAPLIVVLIERPPQLAREIARALIAPAAVLMLVIGLKLLWPAAAYYMLTGPRMFDLRASRWHLTLFTMLSCNILFAAAIFTYLRERRNLSAQQASAARWVLTVCAIMVPACVIFATKEAGKNNSFLPAFVSMAAMVTLMLPALLRLTSGNGPMLQRVATCLFLGALFPAELRAIPSNQDFTTAAATQGGKQYWQVVERVSKLKGRVISPDDPTIAFFAKGYLGRSIQAESDRTGNTHIPPVMLKEIQSADWYVSVEGVWSQQDNLDMDALRFHRVPVNAMNKSEYALWKRNDRPSSSPASQPKMITRSTQ